MRDLINSSNYLAYKFNFSTEHVEFLPINRNEIRRVSSLSREFIDPARQLLPVPLAEIVPFLDASHQQPPVKPPRFIFHTAFCASTFLSRCLDVEGTSTVLREPQILLDAANAKRLQWKSNTTSIDYRRMPELAIKLLQKHAEPTETLIIKPINSVNNIIAELLHMTGSGKSLMLYTDAKNFLLSTLKKGEEAKNTVRAMFDLIRCDYPHLANLRISDAIRMTDLKVILTLWRLQIEQAEQALKKCAPENLMASLYGEKLIAEPLGVLQSANRFLGLGISNQQLLDVVNSDNRHADAKKAGEKFSLEKRAEAYQQVENFYGNDLDHSLRWMTHNNPGTRLIPRLSSTLPN